APGKDEDGVTAAVALDALEHFTPERAAWLVPGMLPELTQALIKTLPKSRRAEIESKGSLADIAGACAEAVRFGDGALPTALSEALSVLHNVEIDAADWSFKSLPAHL